MAAEKARNDAAPSADYTHRARGATRHLEGNGLDALDLLHEGGRVQGLVGGRGGGGGRGGAAGDGVGVRHAVLVLDAVLAARRDVLRRRVLVVEDACGAICQMPKQKKRRKAGCRLGRGNAHRSFA